jgi:hypothetical protein
MNLTQFFDASIKLQEYGYKIHSIEQVIDGKYYFVRFAYTDVCYGLAFGGIQYEIQFYKGSTQPILVHKMVAKKLKLEFDSSEEVSNIDEAVDFIITDIQKLEEELKEEERQKVLAKLTPKEREILGIKE